MAEIVETEFGKFKLLKDHREAFEVKAFNDRYVDYLDKYTFIVGDYSSEMLRFKGFGSTQKALILDYLIESAVPNAPYFILERYKDEEEEAKSK